MIEVVSSAIIPAPASKVWALVRDFNAMPEWNASIRSSVIEGGPADRIGCRRVLAFDDGGVWTHALTELSDSTMTICYAIVGTPLPMKFPIRDYHATIQLQPVTDGGLCFMTWGARFETECEAEMRMRAGQVFQAGFDGLRRRLGSD